VELIAPGFQLSDKDPIAATIELLGQGAIVAIKGLGGFHLCCDAGNPQAVARLREKKRKNNKPFALMAPDVGTIRAFCEVRPEEEALLTDLRRPIVLLKKRNGPVYLPEEVAPHNRDRGVMLPYTPLHYLLFFYPSASHFNALVMTSGNLSEEPIVVDNNEALEKLSGIADAFLLHNRDIFMRVDDSVVRVRSAHGPRIMTIRRSRGYVPGPLHLDDEGPDVLGCGADLKNTFTLTRGSYAVVSQHIGDMENIETLHFFEESLSNMKTVYRAAPVAIAYDLHPGYLSTRWALERAGLPRYGIQHHYAHIASVMAERGLKERVIGVAFDGTGYGTDGNLWGGEFLLCDLHGFTRAGHFKPIPLPGGERAIREGWRTAVSYIMDAAGQERGRAILASLGFMEKFGKEKVEAVIKLAALAQFSPLSSGAGRLFDAVAAITGLCHENTFEGEAGIALENELYGPEETMSAADERYPYMINGGEPLVADFSAMVLKMADDISDGHSAAFISARFHATLAALVQDMTGRLSSDSGIKKVVLSGGVFQNMFLLEKSLHALFSQGLEVFTNEMVPCNDAGISLGQAYIARERVKNPAA
jgi:hydrogenase maturation protein HypF